MVWRRFFISRPIALLLDIGCLAIGCLAAGCSKQGDTSPSIAAGPARTSLASFDADRSAQVAPLAPEAPLKVSAEPTACPKADLIVEVIARDFGWRYRVFVSQGSGEPLLAASADNELHLPADCEVELRITSEDYLCTFAVPELQLRKLAVPELVLAVHLHTGAAGRHEVPVDAMCGMKYLIEGKPGAIVVEGAPQFHDWMERCKSWGG